MPHTIDRQFAVRTLQELVRINSVNPSIDPRGPGEAEIAEYVLRIAADLGLETTAYEPEPGRVSVVATLRGRGSGRSLMLNAHYDTVGGDGMEAPFTPRIHEGRLYGRGAYDMKASLAAGLTVAKALREAGADLAGDLLVAGVADEEYGGLGTADLLEHLTVDAAIVTEPSQLRPCLAHKGFTWLEVVCHGRAAHGSQFDQGIDANLRMGRVLAGVETLERRLRTSAGHPLLGPPSLHAATLEGGSGLSTYAERSVLRIERRTLPGETEAQVSSEIGEILDRLATEDPAFSADLRTLLVRSPFEVSADATIVRCLRRAAGAVLGHDPEPIGENPWMDSATLAEAGIETVVFGPVGGGAHARDEWVDLDSVVRLAEILVETAAAYCG